MKAILFDLDGVFYESDRPVLGAALLAMGEPEKARNLYEEDLEVWPNNGWALAGLARTLAVLGEPERAAEVQGRLAQAWPDTSRSINSSWLGAADAAAGPRVADH